MTLCTLPLRTCKQSVSYLLLIASLIILVLKSILKCLYHHHPQQTKRGRNLHAVPSVMRMVRQEDHKCKTSLGPHSATLSQNVEEREEGKKEKKER